MNWLVMITKTDDGEIVPKSERKWCATTAPDGSERTLCTGEVFGEGEGAARAETKQVTRGGITCKVCLETIKEIKAIRL